MTFSEEIEANYGTHVVKTQEISTQILIKPQTMTRSRLFTNINRECILAHRKND